MHSLGNIDAVKWLLIWILLLVPGAASAQTYFGVLTTPANTGPGGSCCSSTAMVDASNAQVPTDGSCVGCSVITQSQFAAYATAVSAVSNAGQSVSVAMATGLPISGCTTYTAFNGYTFAVTPDAIGYLSSLTGHYTANAATFPNATAVPNIRDTAGGTHPLVSAAQLKAISSILFGYHEALQTYLSKVSAGQSPSMPPTTSSSYGSC